MQLIQNYIARYKEAQDRYSSPRPPDNAETWKPPIGNRYKLDFDVSLCSETGGCRLGAVIRNRHGEVRAWLRQRKPFVRNVEVAEAFASLAAIHLASRLGLRDIVLEGDCLQVIQQLQNPEPSLSLAGNIISEIKHLGLSFNSISFSFTCRETNKVAHLLASAFYNDCEGTHLLTFPNPDVL